MIQKHVFVSTQKNWGPHGAKQSDPLPPRRTESSLENPDYSFLQSLHFLGDATPHHNTPSTKRFSFIPAAVSTFFTLWTYGSSLWRVSSKKSIETAAKPLPLMLRPSSSGFGQEDGQSNPIQYDFRSIPELSRGDQRSGVTLTHLSN